MVRCAVVLFLAFSAFGQSPAGIGRDSKSGATATPHEPVVRRLDAEGMKALLGRRGERPGPVMLYLFYTDCRPCTDRLADVERIFDEYRGKGLDVALVSIAPMDNERKLRDLLRSINRDIATFLLDKLDDDFAEEFLLHDWEPVVPSVFFYSARGNLEYSLLETNSITYPSLRRDAEKLLRNHQKH